MGMIKRPSALLIAAVMLLAMVPAVSFAAATIGIINGDEFCAYDTGIFGTEILVELNKGQTLPQTLKLKASGTLFPHWMLKANNTGTYSFLQSRSAHCFPTSEP